jgi:hypothetical protein
MNLIDRVAYRARVEDLTPAITPATPPSPPRPPPYICCLSDPAPPYSPSHSPSHSCRVRAWTPRLTSAGARSVTRICGRATHPPRRRHFLRRPASHARGTSNTRAGEEHRMVLWIMLGITHLAAVGLRGIARLGGDGGGAVRGLA